MQWKDKADAHRFVVCGDNPLAYRLVNELVSRFDAEVVVVLPNRERNQGPALALLPGVRLVESERLDESTLRDAGVPQAHALALVDSDDVDTIHAGLSARAINDRIRLVLRMSPRLGARISALFEDCAVLSASQVAAPSFVAAALGENTASSIELNHSILYTAPRAAQPRRGHRVVCGLAKTTASATDAQESGAVTDTVVGLVDATHAEGPPDRVELLPHDPDAADLVLVLAEGQSAPRDQSQRSRITLRQLRFLLRNPLIAVLVVALLLVAVGLVLMSVVGHRGWGEAVYESLIDAAGDAQLESDWDWFDKTVQLLVTFGGLALIPIITAIAIEGRLRARLAAQGPSAERATDHVIVAGLGNVGSRVLQQLHERGIPVVGVDSDENARGVGVARSLGVPVVLGDITWWDTLREASVGKARSLVLLTNRDVINLEAALLGRSERAELPVVVRMFDDDLAERVTQRLTLDTKSVSRLAAASFAAAMVDREVIGTISIGRAAVMVAEVPVTVGSQLVGRTIWSCNIAGHSRVIALAGAGGRELDWKPALGHRLSTHNRLIVVATREGLGNLLSSSIPPEAAQAG
jgi:Trk K+ transport system NAD-binding subunit